MNETEEQFHTRRLRRGVEERIQKLRRMIDGIESQALVNLSRAEEGKAPYSAVAGGFLHEITWGTANLHVGSLIADCQRADDAHARGK